MCCGHIKWLYFRADEEGRLEENPICPDRGTAFHSQFKRRKHSTRHCTRGGVGKTLKQQYPEQRTDSFLRASANKKLSRVMCAGRVYCGTLKQ